MNMENTIVGAIGVTACLVLLGMLYGLAAVVLAAVAVFCGFMFVLGVSTAMDDKEESQ